MRRCLILFFVLACAKKSGPQGAPADIQAHVALAQAASCDTLEKSVQDIAVREMRSEMDSEKQWGGYSGGPVAAGGANPAADGAAPASYSTTNVQVAGVDEADFVKNDGTRIFVLSGQTLYAAKSWPPQDLALAAKTQLEGWPSSMFLEGDRLTVFSSIWTTPAGGGAGPGGGGAGAAIACIDCFWGWGSTKVTVLDVSNLAAPKVTSEIYLPGYNNGARRVGSSVRLVLSDAVRWPEGVKWWPDYDPGLWNNHDRYVAAIDALENLNERVIRSTPLSHWFPNGQRKTESGAVFDVGYQCSDFYLANAPEKLGLVTIATLDLNHPETIGRTSIVGEAGVLYATQQHLYLASQHWWWWPMNGQRDFTYIHEFDITDPSKAAYVGSGGVEGHVGDQFAMDEKDGYLRVTTTTMKWLEDVSGSFHTQASTRLSVLAPQPYIPAGKTEAVGNELSLIGEIAPLVDGERLMATRFIGDTGYAVTFRNIDPLVTLDLKDPAHPRKVAELTVPGFSTYLQPIDDTHLLAIGEDLPLDGAGHPDWNRRSVQLSLYDVSDLANPRRTAQQLVGTAWSWSAALWDHHAFNWYRPDPTKPGLLAIPFSDWSQGTVNSQWWDSFTSDVRVFDVDPAGSITPAGALGMNDVYVQVGYGQWTWWYRPYVVRSVLATDQAGRDYVYAVSDAGLRVAPLDDLAHPLATALFGK